MQEPKRTIIRLMCLMFIPALIVACGDDPEIEIGNNDSIVNIPIDTTDANTQLKLNKAQNIFYSIPSPVEMAAMLKKLDAPYEYSYLNDVQQSDKYLKTDKQALNLGIYASDLSYTCIYNQSNESMYYMEVNRKLAEELDISSAIDNQTVESFDANINNRDSVLEILSQTFWKVDAYLKDNGRDNISALIIAGGWIEGMYLTTQMLEQQDASEEIQRKVAEQKYSLDNLISLFETYGDDPMLAATLEDLRSLEEVYSAVKITRENASVSTDEETGVTVIGGSNKIEMSAEDLKAIGDKVLEIRTRIISPI